MAGKENSAMTILMDFAKPCKGKLIGSVVLAVLGALCGMIPYIAVSRGIIMICHEDYAFSKLAFLAFVYVKFWLNSLDSEGFGVSWVFPDLIQKPNDQDSFSRNQRDHFLCLDVEICLLLMALLYLCAARK